ncbi:MAG: TIGR02391 family protein [Oscillatoriales cyanobacterium]|nr:MAG: TIGR02391 family protein [Oscillatoriales cyanobacterium]
MNINFESLLHPRILEHCKKLYLDAHYKYAALEAMTQVELALKEKSDTQDKFGVNLVTNLFGNGKGIKLRVPFGDEMQKQAETLFKGAFVYYRNYCAHDGRKIDDQTCLRVMVLASELLDLIGASKLSFADVGGIEGLIKVGVFSNKEDIVNLLCILDGFNLPDDDLDWLEDTLLERGYTFSQIEPLIDTGLIEYTSQRYVVPIELLDIRDTLPDTIGWFQLTELGKKIAKGS